MISDDKILALLHADNEQLRIDNHQLKWMLARMDARLARIEQALVQDPWTQGREYDDDRDPFPF